MEAKTNHFWCSWTLSIWPCQAFSAQTPVLEHRVKHPWITCLSDLFSPDRISQIPFSTNKGLSPTVRVDGVVPISANTSLLTKGFKQTKELHVRIVYLDADCTLHHASRNCKHPFSTLWVVHLLSGFVDFVVHFDIWFLYPRFKYIK